MAISRSCLLGDAKAVRNAAPALGPNAVNFPESTNLIAGAELRRKLFGGRTSHCGSKRRDKNRSRCLPSWRRRAWAGRWGPRSSRFTSSARATAAQFDSA